MAKKGQSLRFQKCRSIEWCGDWKAMWDTWRRNRRGPHQCNKECHRKCERAQGGLSTPNGPNGHKDNAIQGIWVPIQLGVRVFSLEEWSWLGDALCLIFLRYLLCSFSLFSQGWGCGTNAVPKDLAKREKAEKARFVSTEAQCFHALSWGHVYSPRKKCREVL